MQYRRRDIITRRNNTVQSTVGYPDDFNSQHLQRAYTQIILTHDCDVSFIHK